MQNSYLNISSRFRLGNMSNINGYSLIMDPLGANRSAVQVDSGFTARGCVDLFGIFMHSNTFLIQTVAPHW